MVRRAGHSVLVLLGLMALLFFAINVLGNPIRLLVDQDAPPETIAALEEKYGFDEAIKDQPFFNVGKSQQWKTQLNSTQKNLIENEFRDEMVKFKYL